MTDTTQSTVPGPDKKVIVEIDALIPARCRKVVPADLDRATAAAMAAFRATLEGCRPRPYEIEALTSTVSYSYVHHSQVFDG